MMLCMSLAKNFSSSYESYPTATRAAVIAPELVPAILLIRPDIPASSSTYIQREIMWICETDTYNNQDLRMLVAGPLK